MRMTVTILLAFVAHVRVHAKETIVHHPIDAEPTSDKEVDNLVDKLVTNLFQRALHKLPLLHADQLAARPCGIPILALRAHSLQRPLFIPSAGSLPPFHRCPRSTQSSTAPSVTQQEEEDWDLVKYTAEDAKNRGPEWARAPVGVEEQRKKWRKQDAPAGEEYAWPGSVGIPKTKNLSALLCLDLVEETDVDAAVRRVLPVLSDELLVILVHSIHELKQTYVQGRPKSGRAFRVDAKPETAALYEKVLNAWNAQRTSPPSAATLRVADFIRDVASDIARPTKKMYTSDDCVLEALESGALEQDDLPTLSSLAARAFADIQAPPCTKYQSLRIALKQIQSTQSLTRHPRS